MLYEMVARTPPFSGSTPTDTIVAILTHDPEPLSHHLRSIPAGLERIVTRCLAKIPMIDTPPLKLSEKISNK